MALAVHCAQQLLTGASAEQPADDEDMPLVAPATAGRRGPVPVLLEGRSEQEQAELVAERIAKLYAEGAALDEIAVLARIRPALAAVERCLRRRHLACQSMASQAIRSFDWHTPSVKLLTMHSAKGLEFPHVFVVGLQTMPMRDETIDEAVRLLYVAMTRSTHTLVLSTHGDSAVTRRVRAALATLQGPPSHLAKVAMHRNSPRDSQP
jgi:superfamily I DNA/RNA helicase